MQSAPGAGHMACMLAPLRLLLLLLDPLPVLLLISIAAAFPAFACCCCCRRCCFGHYCSCCCCDMLLQLRLQACMCLCIRHLNLLLKYAVVIGLLGANLLEVATACHAPKQAIHSSIGAYSGLMRAGNMLVCWQNAAVLSLHLLLCFVHDDALHGMESTPYSQAFCVQNYTL